MGEDRSHISLRIASELLERIDAEAEARMVSRTWLIDKALRDWLSENAEMAS